ncbi:unnamed protein product, partial [Didymodactylos carnosus]
MAGNALLAGIETNYGYSTVNDSYSLYQVYFPYNYTDCSCKQYPITCGQWGGVFLWEFQEAEVLFLMPGFYIACFTIESLFLSTFECYFNQSCLDTINQLIGLNSQFPFNATAMSYTESQSQYSVTTKIQDIVEQLMIEQWNDEISFDSYFEACRPASCLYTYNKRGDAVYVITTTIGLIGGLTTLLTHLSSLLISYLRRKKRPVQTTDTIVVMVLRGI